MEIERPDGTLLQEPIEERAKAVEARRDENSVSDDAIT
jgi:hypothetical protein